MTFPRKSSDEKDEFVGKQHHKFNRFCVIKHSPLLRPRFISSLDDEASKENDSTVAIIMKSPPSKSDCDGENV